MWILGIGPQRRFQTGNRIARHAHFFLSQYCIYNYPVEHGSEDGFLPMLFHTIQAQFSVVWRDSPTDNCQLFQPRRSDLAAIFSSVHLDSQKQNQPRKEEEKQKQKQKKQNLSLPE